MPLIALFLGVPATFVSLVLTMLLILLGINLSKKISITSVKILIQFVFSIPFNIAMALFLGGTLTALINYFKQGMNGLIDYLIIIPISFLMGSLNILSPGGIALGDNGPTFDTTINSFICFFILLAISFYIIVRKNKKSNIL
ncbi:MAG: hypothetical protein PHQ90_05295 [Sulfuricurvum sp.]|uniref:hypothetical protein n=1 Tax=Sulfuricurvum sp. TaxID=2025608 RepID=UPI0026329C0B|nr:hypothetical protein [Sulfuricurvum sp.]MDD2368698.1 hypothetical protein [Sulfuricurvum sp.]MDD5118491.1 hypothetical protein [Sulfuricurvum sp.]